MSRYLLVAHQTATDPLVLRRTQEIRDGDPDATFTILVPETHIEHPLVCDEIATREVARAHAEEAAAAFRRAGLRVLRASTGDSNPLRAVQDEMLFHPGEHDAVVLSTFPPGVSRWLHLDLPARLHAQHVLPVFHVYEGGDEVWAAAAALRREVARRIRPASADMHPSPLDRIGRLAASLPFVPALIVLLGIHIALVTGLALRYDLRFFRLEIVMLMIVAILVASVVGTGSWRGLPWRGRRST